MQIKDILT